MFHQYPYTDFHELNMDWLLSKMKIFEEGYLDKYIEAGQLVTPMIFGAVKDDLVDDSTAFHSFYDYNGGFKYIPSGSYLVDGVLRRFEYGCLGNGDEIEMPSYTYKDEFDTGEYAFERDGNGPLYQNYSRVTDPANFKPVNQVTFEQEYTGNISYNNFNAGMVGFEVKGGVKGDNNTMPIGFRSVLYSESGGNGDVVGVWSRVYKADPADGTNLSDACAGHFSIYNNGTGTGLAMANEIWIRNKRPQGTQGTQHSNYYYPGGAVGSHYSARSRQGMAQSHILVGGTADTDLYGVWSIMSINNKAFRYNGNTAYPENTTVFKMPDFTAAACPNIVNWYGFTPYHVKMNGGYRYNIGADETVFMNSTLNGAPALIVSRQENADTDETGKTTTIALAHQSYGGETHAPNINSVRSVAWRVYHVVGNNNIFYRAEAGDDNVDRRNHLFYCYNGEENVPAMGIGYNEVYPGRDLESNLGSSTLRWKNIYAQKITIGGVEVGEDAANDKLRTDYDIIFWGDSLTQGVGGAGTTYPAVCAEELGMTYLNAGSGGESANTIAARQGGNYIMIPAGNINGTYAPFTDCYGRQLTPLISGSGGHTGDRLIINGVTCNLSYSNNLYTISGYNKGPSDVPLMARFIGSNLKARFNCFMVGTNGYNIMGNSSTDELTAILDSMIQHANPDKCIIMSVTNSNETIETVLRYKYGSAFYNARVDLIENGLEIMDMEPTAQDTEDISNGLIPSSLRNDNVHLNATGYTALGKLLARYMKGVIV